MDSDLLDVLTKEDRNAVSAALKYKLLKEIDNLDLSKLAEVAVEGFKNGLCDYLDYDEISYNLASHLEKYVKSCLNKALKQG